MTLLTHVFDLFFSLCSDCGKLGCEAATGVKPGEAGQPSLAAIEAQYARTGQQWSDPDFPPNASSLLRDPATSQRNDWKQLKWARPEEIRGMTAPVIFQDGADPLDITQGSIGDWSESKGATCKDMIAIQLDQSAHSSALCSALLYLLRF